MKLCYNCTNAGHVLKECRSKRRRSNCGGKYHTSLCESTKSTKEQILLTKSIVTYPVVIIKVYGIKCRTLLDTGAGSFCASSTLMNKIGTDATRKESRQIEMLMYKTSQMVEIYRLRLFNIEEDFEIYAEMFKVNKRSLLTIPNPHYENVIKK